MLKMFDYNLLVAIGSPLDSFPRNWHQRRHATVPSVENMAQHFGHYMEGRVEFHILTDHKRITYALQTTHSRLPLLKSWHFSLIAEFTSDIRHVKGTHNSAAYALSRTRCCNAIPNAVDFAAIAAAQKGDKEIQRLRYASSNLDLRDVSLPGCDATPICVMTTASPRPVAPPTSDGQF